MVTPKNVVARFKLARRGPRVNWVPYNKDNLRNNRATIIGNDGEWAFNAVMTEGAGKWRIQITVPSGSKDPKPGTYEWPRPYASDKLEDAKKELGFWIDDLCSKGTIQLTGWKKV